MKSGWAHCSSSMGFCCCMMARAGGKSHRQLGLLGLAIDFVDGRKDAAIQPRLLVGFDEAGPDPSVSGPAVCKRCPGWWPIAHQIL